MLAFLPTGKLVLERHLLCKVEGLIKVIKTVRTEVSSRGFLTICFSVLRDK